MRTCLRTDLGRMPGQATGPRVLAVTGAIAHVTDGSLDRYRTRPYCIGIEPSRRSGARTWNRSPNSPSAPRRPGTRRSATVPSPTPPSSPTGRAAGSSAGSERPSAVPWPVDDGYGAMARVTLQTIADRLGVSRMTVSNAFSRPDQLSAPLRDRILAEATAL